MNQGSQKKDLTVKEFLSDNMLMILAIRKGIPYSLFDLIKLLSPLSKYEWAEILEISSKTLERYKENEKKFKSLQSEKIIETAEVINAGLDVFGDNEKFNLWLKTPNFALGNLKPIDLLKDSYGKELVISELTRINHGIFV